MIPVHPFEIRWDLFYIYDNNTPIYPQFQGVCAIFNKLLMKISNAKNYFAQYFKVV